MVDLVVVMVEADTTAAVIMVAIVAVGVVQCYRSASVGPATMRIIPLRIITRRLLSSTALHQ